MADFKKAKTHHSKIGAAIAAGNAALAMHHVGHMMLALKGNPVATQPSPDQPQVQDSPVQAPVGIRQRLAMFARGNTPS